MPPRAPPADRRNPHQPAGIVGRNPRARNPRAATPPVV